MFACFRERAGLMPNTLRELNAGFRDAYRFTGNEAALSVGSPARRGRRGLTPAREAQMKPA